MSILLLGETDQMKNMKAAQYYTQIFSKKIPKKSREGYVSNWRLYFQVLLNLHSICLCRVLMPNLTLIGAIRCPRRDENPKIRPINKQTSLCRNVLWPIL